MRLSEANVEFHRGYFSTHKRGKKTEAAYRSDLVQFLAFAGEEFDLPSLNATVIESWAAHLREEEYSPASIRRKIVVLKVFCSYWVRKGMLPESPFWRVKLSFGRIEQIPRALTEREIRSLLRRAWRNYLTISAGQDGSEEIAHTVNRKCSSRKYRALRDLALVDLLFATGMRVGEASALDVRDYFAKEGVFRVQGKGGRDRLAFVVDEQTVQIQRVHMEARARIRTDNPALFVNAWGGRLSTQGITNVIAKLRREARIKRHVTPHMLRHTVATLLLRNGVDIRMVQEFLGHASIATTQRYTHITKEHMVRVLRKRHPSLNLRFGPIGVVT
ncbi:MAG TPA: tyrosine-type recombinase/integrase [Pyrinomonadaceae bacterium]|jgi:integrase/recombinase XerD